MRLYFKTDLIRRLAMGAFLLATLAGVSSGNDAADDVLRGLRGFYARTAGDDGSFSPGIDPAYSGMSDSAYSDLAAVTYAVVLHKTFGWKLPHEDETTRFLLSRQQPNGDFFNVAGTVDPRSAEGRVYNTTQGLVASPRLGAVAAAQSAPCLRGNPETGLQDTSPPIRRAFFRWRTWRTANRFLLRPTAAFGRR